MTIQWPGLFFIAWGLYVFFTSFSTPEGYKRNFRSGLFSVIFGDKIARIIFIALGALIVIAGLCIFFTIVDAHDDVIKYKIGGSK